MYITPKEVYHLFSSHHDSKHYSAANNDGLQISVEHHHCELSKIDQQFSASAINFIPHDFSKLELFFSNIVATKVNKVALRNFIAERILRGPPAA